MKASVATSLLTLYCSGELNFGRNPFAYVKPKIIDRSDDQENPQKFLKVTISLTPASTTHGIIKDGTPQELESYRALCKEAKFWHTWVARYDREADSDDDDLPSPDDPNIKWYRTYCVVGGDAQPPEDIYVDGTGVMDLRGHEGKMEQEIDAYMPGIVYWGVPAYLLKTDRIADQGLSSLLYRLDLKPYDPHDNAVCRPNHYWNVHEYGILHETPIDIRQTGDYMSRLDDAAIEPDFKLPDYFEKIYTTLLDPCLLIRHPCYCARAPPSWNCTYCQMHENFSSQYLCYSTDYEKYKDSSSKKEWCTAFSVERFSDGRVNLPLDEATYRELEEKKKQGDPAVLSRRIWWLEEEEEKLQERLANIDWLPGGVSPATPKCGAGGGSNHDEQDDYDEL